MKEFDDKTYKHVLASLIYLFKNLFIYLIVLLNAMAWDRCWRLWFIAGDNRDLQTLLEHTLYRSDAHFAIT